MRRVVHRNKKGKNVLVNIPSYDLHYVNNQFGYSGDLFSNGSGAGGSIDFNGEDRFFTLDGSNDWAVGTGDFTVEWYQYQTTLAAGTFPRVFTIGSYLVDTGMDMAVTIENGTFYVWLNATAIAFTPAFNSDNLTNQWIHFAVTRNGTSLRAFRNGVQFSTTKTNSANVSEVSKPLYIGADGNTEANTRFPGYITNFHFVKGTALYTSNFTPPSLPIQPVSDTKLLLLAITSDSILVDSSLSNKTVTSTNPIYSVLSPFI